MARRRVVPSDQPPGVQLESLVQEALGVAKKGARHNQSLSGDNFYGNKLAALRADATNIFSDIASDSAGDTSATAELIQTVFAGKTPKKQRSDAARNLIFSLRTAHRPRTRSSSPHASQVFPQTLLVETNRGYLTRIGRQVNANYSEGWFDACFVMLRRLLEVSIIEAFEARQIAHKIRNANGDYVHLTDLIDLALAEHTWNLSRNTKKHLPKLRDMGHMSAHGRYFTAQREDIDPIRDGCRVVIEEFLHHARLL